MINPHAAMYRCFSHLFFRKKNNRNAEAVTKPGKFYLRFWMRATQPKFDHRYIFVVNTVDLVKPAPYNKRMHRRR